MGYVVEIKPSARRVSAAAGEWIAERGRRRRFETKPLAREWARSLGDRDRTLWVQDAHPLDSGPADGYLMARHRTRTRTRTREDAGNGFEQVELTGP